MIQKSGKSINELAVNIYKEGYDIRFQAAQAIPVFVNEILVRFVYSVRRLISFDPYTHGYYKVKLKK